MIAAALLALVPVPVLQEWSELPSPGLCSTPVEGYELRPLVSGAHVDLDGASAGGASPWSDGGGFHLPHAVLAQLLEEEARRAGRELRVLRPGPPLLATGSSDALQAARRTCAELSQASARQTIRLSAWLLPERSESGGVSPRSADLGLPAPTFEAAARSGDPVLFGTRAESLFLAGYRAEVAASSEVADPALRPLWTGTTLHLTAWRVAGGRELLIDGLLDIAEGLGLENFDTGCADLGTVQMPRIRVVQVRFGGRVPSGGALRISLQGAPLGVPDQTLVVGAETEPEPGEFRPGWQVLDLAALETDSAPWPVPSPGLGMLSAVQRTGPPGGPQRLGASGLWNQFQANLRSAGGATPQVLPVPGLLLARFESADVLADVSRLIAAAEAARGATALLRVECGDLRVELPALAGLTTRVLVGEERTRLYDYDAQIAPESWMAAPEVGRTFDGILVQGRLDGERMPFTWWRAGTIEQGELSPRETTHGRLREFERRIEGQRSALALPAQEAQLAPESSDVPAAGRGGLSGAALRVAVRAL